METKTLTLSTPSKGMEILLNAIRFRKASEVESKKELIQQWISQGKDFISLENDYEQDALSMLTGVSRSSMKRYRTLANDKRLELCLSDNKLEKFNQEQLIKLTKLDDEAFESCIKGGPAALDVITKKIINSSISNKVDQIKQLTTDVVEMRKAKANKLLFHNSRAVNQINEDGRVIAQYRSALDAQTATGIDRMTIGKVCRGVAMSAGGFDWSFIVNESIFG